MSRRTGRSIGRWQAVIDSSGPAKLRSKSSTSPGFSRIPSPPHVVITRSRKLSNNHSDKLAHVPLHPVTYYLHKLFPLTDGPNKNDLAKTRGQPCPLDTIALTCQAELGAQLVAANRGRLTEAKDVLDKGQAERGRIVTASAREAKQARADTRKKAMTIDLYA